MLQNFLIPFLAALAILIFGWGNLFMFALKTKTLKRFLLHPAFVVGDLIILPSIGFLVVYFYQQAAVPEIIMQMKWIYFPVVGITSLIVSLSSAFRSLIINKSMKFDIFLVPHFFFYWSVSFTLIHFFFTGLVQILFSGWSVLMLAIYSAVAIGIVMHLILPVIFGRKTFDK